tara:strand:+ start:350 stop:925 length:576 start_codon:yes stop_codon:yes gene_type:complete
MSFYFKPFPKVNYELKKNNNPLLLTNITQRFKIRDTLKNFSAIYYDYLVQDHDRPDMVAFKYYGDETLDWVLFLINDIIDPYYDWPMDQRTFNNYMRSLYGSVDSAKSTVFEYRKIINQQGHLIDGTVIPKRTVVIDTNTYNSLAPTSREIIYGYNYYEELNDVRRRIRILDKDFIGILTREVENIFNTEE